MVRLFLLILGLSTFNAGAQEQPVTGKVLSVGLFKNGLAVVTEEIKVGGSGIYQLDTLPQATHGTFWVESDARVITRTARRHVKKPLDDMNLGSIGLALANREVQLTFKDGSIPLKAYAMQVGKGLGGQFMMLATESERLFVSTENIDTIRTAATRDEKVMQHSVEQKVLLFEVASQKPATITLSYLIKGISWAPAYRLDLKDRSRLKVTQQSLIRNEWRDLKDAHLYLISGYPNIHFAHVTTPLATTWASFYTQIRHQAPQHAAAMSNVISQQAISINRTGSEPPSGNPMGEGRDMYFHEVGRFSLDKDEAMVLTTAQAETSYRRVAEWSIADRRDEEGRPVRNAYNDQTPMDEPWDTIVFANPFSHPMTTAPAQILDGGWMAGQSLSTWVNPGGTVNLKVTKALSLEVRDVERVEDREPEMVKRFNRRYHIEKVSGSFTIANSRAFAVEMLVDKRFTGKLIEAEGKPTASVKEDGLYQVNRRNELVWKLNMAPGEVREISYSYEVLVKD